MSYIDVAIPLVIGLLLVIRPHAFVKRAASQVLDSERTSKLRKIGLGLIAVAALYFIIKLASR